MDQILAIFGQFFRKIFAAHFSRRIFLTAVFRFREKCEKFAKNCPKIAKIWSKIDLKIALLAQTGIVIEFLIGFNSLLELYLPD